MLINSEKLYLYQLNRPFFSFNLAIGNKINQHVRYFLVYYSDLLNRISKKQKCDFLIKYIKYFIRSSTKKIQSE